MFSPETNPVPTSTSHKIKKIEKFRSIFFTGMRIRSVPLIFGPPDPDPLLLFIDPDSTCNNGFRSLEQNIHQN